MQQEILNQIRKHLTKLKLPELKNVARFYNLEERIKYSKFRKPELIAELIKHIDYQPALTGEKIKKAPKAKKPQNNQLFLKRQISEGTSTALENLQVQTAELAHKIEEGTKKRQALAKELAEKRNLEREKRRLEDEQIMKRIRELESLF